MMISKKWWVFLLVGMLFGLGIIYLRGLSSSKVIKETETEVSDQKTEVPVGQELVTVNEQLVAEVVSWDSGISELTFKLKDNGKVMAAVVDSSKMSLFIPEAQHKTDAVLPLSNGDKNWETAYCPGDSLTVGFGDSGEVKMLFNTGYRMCGLKGN